MIDFFYVGSPKEDIFSGHLLSPVFQSSLHITITGLCLCVDAERFSFLKLCALNLILACLTSIQHTPLGPTIYKSFLFIQKNYINRPQAGFEPPFAKAFHLLNEMLAL